MFYLILITFGPAEGWGGGGGGITTNLFYSNIMSAKTTTVFEVHCFAQCHINVSKSDLGMFFSLIC